MEALQSERRRVERMLNTLKHDLWNVRPGHWGKAFILEEELKTIQDGIAYWKTIKN